MAVGFSLDRAARSAIALCLGMSRSTLADPSDVERVTRDKS
jgi:hypothetical protein